MKSHVIADDQSHDRYVANLYSKPRWRRRQLLVGSGCSRMLYKYFACDAKVPDHLRNVRSVLVQSQLWFSKPSSFNDPFDFRCHVRFSDDPASLRQYFEATALRLSRSMGGSNHVVKARAREMARRTMERHIADPDAANEIFQSIRDGFGVCCLTTRAKSLLMWAHYAQSHTGICFQFDTSEDIELFAPAMPITYVRDFPQLKWPADRDAVVEKVVFRKSTEWEYERERRIVENSLADKAHKFSPKALRGLIVGHRASDETKTELRSMLKERERRGLPPIKVYNCVLSKNAYSMGVFRATDFV